MTDIQITFTITGDEGIGGIISNIAEDMANELMDLYSPRGRSLAGFDGPYVRRVETDASPAVFITTGGDA